MREDRPGGVEPNSRSYWHAYSALVHVLEPYLELRRGFRIVRGEARAYGRK